MTIDVSQFDPETRRMLESVKLGYAAQDFLVGDVGKEIVKRARLIANDAARRLKEADPHDWKRITELQNLARWGEGFEQFIEEMIALGETAEEQIKHGEQNDE